MYQINNIKHLKTILFLISLYYVPQFFNDIMRSSNAINSLLVWRYMNISRKKCPLEPSSLRHKMNNLYLFEISSFTSYRFWIFDRPGCVTFDDTGSLQWGYCSIPPCPGNNQIYNMMQEFFTIFLCKPQPFYNLQYKSR